MKIDEHERRDHIVATNSEAAEAAWLNRDIGSIVVTYDNIRPCGVDIGKCWVVTYKVNDTRSAERCD